MSRPSALVIRRSLIALGGGACAALGAVLLADFARPQQDAVDADAAAARPLIIDGPPTQVEAAPPPPARATRRIHRRIDPYPDGDDEGYETASAAAPFQAPPPQAPQAPMPPPDAQMQAGQMQAGQMQAGQMRAYGPRREPPGPCGGPAGPADQMVCASPRLSAADMALERLYDMDLYRTDNPDALRDEQRRWRAVRDRVAAEDGPQGLAELYAERIQELGGPY